MKNKAQRLIDANKTVRDLRGIKDMLVAAGDPFLASVINRAIACVENQPTAASAAEPARWENVDTDAKCSACGRFAVADKYAVKYFDFCPHCGAKMEREGERPC